MVVLLVSNLLYFLNVCNNKSPTALMSHQLNYCIPLKFLWLFNKLQVLAFDLPECAGIEVYDGEDFTAPLLDKLTSDHYSHNVVSTGNELSVYYQTCDEIEGDATDYHGFQIMYRTGESPKILMIKLDSVWEGS